MKTADILRNNIIEKLFKISDKEYLLALYKLIENVKPDQISNLSEEQIEMLRMSDIDIQEGNLILHQELDESDLRWLREL